IIILGAGGHATVLVELAKTLKKNILGVVAPTECQLKNYPDIPYLGNDTIISQRYATQDVKLVNGLGAVSVQKNSIRRDLFLHFKALGYGFETLIHPSAIIASTALLHEGAQVMARVVIQPNTTVGKNTIINTGACIDHDGVIHDHV